DPDIPLTAIQDMEQVVSDAVWRPRMEMNILTGFAALAMVLAVAGIYAVMCYVVGGRTQEIGIRMALGARRGDVLGMVLAQSLRPVAAGLVIGVAGAARPARPVTKMVCGISPGEPPVLSAGPAILGLVALAAAMGPARRAASVDPLVALREESLHWWGRLQPANARLRTRRTISPRAPIPIRLQVPGSGRNVFVKLVIDAVRAAPV